MKCLAAVALSALAGFVIALSARAQSITAIYSFDNTNGAGPDAGLTLGSDDNFYGTAYLGGNSSFGTVFRISTNGTLTALHSFNNANGSYPVAPLTLGPDGNFYGTTETGGRGYGTVFQITPNGAFMTLVNFNITNGAYPVAALTLGPDGNFYGITPYGGSANDGVIFRVTTGGILTALASFVETNGINPIASLTLGPDGNFYGTAYFGGSAGNGTIFRLNLPPDFVFGPTNQLVFTGVNVAFNCQPFGTAPFAYQWLSNGIPVAGATNATLSLGPALAGGTYQVIVTNAYGSVTSQVASLNVLIQPNLYAISNSSGGNHTVFLGSYPNSTNRLWATTNLALPFAQWQLIATSVTDSNGLAQFLDTNTPGKPQKFYRLSYP